MEIGLHTWYVVGHVISPNSDCCTFVLGLYKGPRLHSFHIFISQNYLTKYTTAVLEWGCACCLLSRCAIRTLQELIPRAKVRPNAAVPEWHNFTTLTAVVLHLCGLGWLLLRFWHVASIQKKSRGIILVKLRLLWLLLTFSCQLQAEVRKSSTRIIDARRSNTLHKGSQPTAFDQEWFVNLQIS